MHRRRSACSEYFENSNIHGLRYLAMSHRSWGERLWWLVMILSALYGCTRLISNVYDKWQTSPVIVSIAETALSIRDIPFPAVTICPQTKSKATIFNLTDVFDRVSKQNMSIDDLTDIEKQRLAALSQLCEQFLYNHRLTFDKPLDCSKCVQTMKDMMAGREEMIFKCFFRLNSLCVEDFVEVITDEGLCYTFNGMPLTTIYREESIDNDIDLLRHSYPTDQWTLEDGYKPDVPLDSYPKRALRSGISFGLSLIVRLPDDHFDPLCRGPTPGFTVVLHTPQSTPATAQNFIRVALNQETTIKVKPNGVITSPNLKKYAPKVRQCFFNNERYLRFFQTYTQRNCEIECFTNATFSKCGCVRFHMPKFSGVRICNSGDLKCSGLVVFEQTFQDAKDVCHCLPACTSLTFDTEIFQTAYEATKYAWSIGAESNDGYSSIIIIFNEEQFFPFQRSELYGFIDFVANCGGLLGLFLGVSLISIVEIVYFGTLRLICTLQRRRQRPTRLSPAVTPVFVLRNPRKNVKFVNHQRYF